ncbi:uncharacterized protein IL334_006995 [Kwoniella shivajii]|uniref:Mediator of RNA polymerase II transcription subunit 13 n=1 Tax=Kwoniella shivajii TaxID=564305 RepID=A0ABZ1DBF4_9TREE|nr:hypothetical protein IL334_006995 [Kwoniella shivajii]
MPDYLGGNPPRPSTVIPGQWILDLPSSDTHIHIRRYRQAEEANQAGPSVFRDVILDPTEKAWRTINDNSVEEDIPVARILERPCAIITAEAGDTKTLWCFSIENERSETFEALQEISPSLPPLAISQLITCSKHGHEISCLDNQVPDSLSCNVSLDTSEDTNRYLNLFASAVVEKLAWNRGSRISLYPNFGVQPSLRTTIRPLTSEKLLLSIRSTTLPSTTISISPTPLLLSPLGMPAFLISPFHPTSAQESHLISTFESALGHVWKHGQSEARIHCQLSGETYSDWSILWVPIVDLSSSKGKLTSRQIVDKWQSSNGVLTIWPTHLSHPYFNINLPHYTKPLIKPLQPESAQLLDLSTGLFDFLSTYKEPEPVEEIEDEEIDEEDVNMDTESTTITADPENETVNGNDFNDIEDGGTSEKSDLDDLFSEHSNSIPNSPHIHIHADKVDTPIEAISIPDENDSGNAENQIRSRNPTNGNNGVEPKEELVTEADFAFFDSPTDEMTIAEPGDTLEELDKLQENTTEREEKHMEIDNYKDLLPLASLEEVRPHPIVMDENQDAIFTEDPGSPLASSRHPPNQPIPDTNRDEQLQASTSMPEPAHDPTAHQDLALSPIPNIILPRVKSSSFSTDLIPPSFSPLVLLPVSDSPFPYSLPSPAPTPSSLNWDLVERLQPTKCTNLTYADDWKMEEEVSEIDEEEEYTGPPTPESSYISDDEDVAKPEIKISEGHEIDFGGTRCIGVEWLYLIYETDKVKELAKEWNPSWNRDNMVLPPTASEDWDKRDLLKGVDLTTFVNELIGNRALREIGHWSELGYIPGRARIRLPLIEGGIALSDLSKDSKIRKLPQPQISTGYHNYVVNLSIPSLHYWSELGLQPQGGNKNAEVVIYCEDNHEARERAMQVVSGITQVWEQLRLGKHELADTGGQNAGIISLPADLKSPINLLDHAQTNSVIYILLPSTNIDSCRTIFSTTYSQPSSRIVHSIPQHASTQSHFRDIAFEVYNRLPEVIKEIAPRSVSDPYNLQMASSSDKTVTRQVFTLARNEIPQPEFSMAWPLRSYDVMNNHRSVILSYTIHEDLDLMIAFIADDLGESSTTKVWTGTNGSSWNDRINKIKTWSQRIADEWFIECKMIMIRVGTIEADELKSWRKALQDSQMRFTLLTVDNSYKQDGEDNIPRPRGLANIPSSTLNDHNSRLIDLSLSAHLTTLPLIRIPLDLKSSSQIGTETIYPIKSFMLSHPTKDRFQSKLYHILQIHQYSHPSNKKENDIEDEVSKVIYNLGCLIQSRWGIISGLEGILDVAINGLNALSKGSED